jgi:hypothetical protein
VTRYTLRAIEPADRPVVTSLLVREWGAVEVVALSIGGVVDASTLPGLIAEQDGEVVGLLTYLVDGRDVELVTINAFTALRAGAVAEARKLKPQIPEFGHDGIPIRDELELEFLIS